MTTATPPSQLSPVIQAEWDPDWDLEGDPGCPKPDGHDPRFGHIGANPVDGLARQCEARPSAQSRRSHGDLCRVTAGGLRGTLLMLTKTWDPNFDDGDSLSLPRTYPFGESRSRVCVPGATTRLTDPLHRVRGIENLRVPPTDTPGIGVRTHRSRIVDGEDCLSVAVHPRHHDRSVRCGSG